MSYAIESGKLRHRVDIQAHAETRNAIGETLLTWSTSVTRWAQVRPLSGKELEHARQIDSRTTHKIVIRYYGDLSYSNRFLWKGRKFNIISLLNILERDKLQVCLCVEEGLE